MESQYMMVNPHELVIDLPVDDAHVQELMELLQKNGRMIEPVTVWLSGMRIINGFHRTEAAKRLGWAEIPCLIQDCTEDEFWDARIIAAKPHHSIESARLAIWMRESWALTPWANQNLQEKVWDTIRKRKGAVSRFTDTDEGLTAEQIEIKRWISDKASRWGVSIHDVAEKVLPNRMSHVWGSTSEVLDDISAKYDLSYSQRIAVGEQVNQSPRRYNMGYDPEEVEQWVESEIITNKPTRKNIAAFLDDELKKKKDAIRQAEERKQVYWQSEAGKAEIKKEQIALSRKELKDITQTVASRIKAIQLLPEIPDAPAILAEFSESIFTLGEKFFPGIELAKPNPVSLENARLRAENARLRERIASLERALGSKNSAGSMIANAVAWSSTDFDRPETQ